MLICDKCFTEVGVGKSHNKDLCKAATRRMNVVQAISESGDRTRRQILTEGLQEVMDEEGCLGKGDTVTLPRVHGPPLTMTRGAIHPKPQVKFPHGSLLDLQKTQGITDKGMKGFCQWLRVHTGRDSVDPYFREAMQERNHAFENFFRHEKVRFMEYYTPDAEGPAFGEDGSRKKKPQKQLRPVEKSLAYCTDVNAFVTEIIAERGLDPERTIVQIGLDDGQGLIKVMMTIKTLEDDQHLVLMDKKRRSSYSDYAPLKFKDSGVQKLMLLAVAPVCEKYENLTYIMHGEARPQWV